MDGDRCRGAAGGARAVGCPVVVDDALVASAPDGRGRDGAGAGGLATLVSE